MKGWGNVGLKKELCIYEILKLIESLHILYSTCFCLYYEYQNFNPLVPMYIYMNMYIFTFKKQRKKTF